MEKARLAALLVLLFAGTIEVQPTFYAILLITGYIQHIFMESDRAIKHNAFTTKAGNVVWAAAMQLAWDELRHSFANGSPLLFHTENPTSLATIQNFNEGVFKKSDIDPQSVYVKSGYGQATLNTINKEVKEKFPQKTIPPFNGPLQDTDIISYAYLFKQLLFEVKFDRRQHKQFQFNGKTVDSFYAQNLKQKQQVLVHSYVDQNTFVVEIKGKNQKDSLFLIKNEGVKTVDEAIKLTLENSNQHPEPLKKHDIFEMPVIKLSADRTFKEMIKLHFKNPELSQYQIGEMFEGVKLSVDESGAKVENQAVIVALRTMAIIQNKKIIVLDKSFWVVMKEAGKNPYLCVFVNEPIQE